MTNTTWLSTAKEAAQYAAQEIGRGNDAVIRKSTVEPGAFQSDSQAAGLVPQVGDPIWYVDVTESTEEEAL